MEIATSFCGRTRNDESMNIEQLKTFREIARLGSFSAVAKELGVSQPAVSFQIQKLEQELGTRLIDRSQRAIALTEAGRRLLRFAEEVEGERVKLQHDLEEMRDEITGDLSIAASTIPGEYLLPPLLAKFKQQHPAVKIQVSVSDSLTVINQVCDNIYEVGFCGIEPEEKDLAFFKIGSDEIVLIVFSGHPFAQKGEVTPDELADEHFIFREGTSGTQRSLKNILARGGLDIRKWSPHLILGSTQAVIAAVAAGAGIAFVSSIAIKRGAALAAVREVKVRSLQTGRDFYCLYRRERAASKLLEEFRNFIRLETAQSSE
jgi:molybdate transport repressor ModE-like protein